MAILVTGDIHWNEVTRDRYRHDFVGTLESHLIHRKVETLIILGDLTEEKDRHAAWLVNQVFEHIGRLSLQCPVIILKGNHDYLQPSTPFFMVLNRLPNVTWINEPTVISDLDLPGGRVLFLPHTRDHKTDWKKVNVKKYKYVFAHNTFQGAKTENGIELDGIPRSVFSKKQTVISGDIHVPQTIGCITYAGAPYPINFGDTYDAHMLLIYGTGVLEVVQYNGPRKVVLDMEIGDDNTTIAEWTRPGDLVKINVHLNPDNQHAAFLEYKKWLVSQFDQTGCVLISVNPILVHGKSISVRKRRKLRRRSDDSILTAYASSRGVKKAGLKAGRRLMRKV